MAVFKEFSNADIKTDKDQLEQLVDVLENDISSSFTRKKYQIFLTSSGVGPGVTSSIVQTVFDQDFTYQTANAVFDVTFGLSKNSNLVSGSVTYIDATTGKYYFPSQSLMMREKMDMYRQMAQQLLGDADAEFRITSGSTSNIIREPLFILFKRLFARDALKRDTFAIKLFQSASGVFNTPNPQGSKIYTDNGASSNKELSFGGQVSTLVDSSNTSYGVGLIYADRGVVVVDTQRVFTSGSTQMSGSIRAANATGTTPFTGSLNQFLVSASMDDILEHVCTTRFSSSANTAIAFENITNINSTIFFCKFAPDEFNYSSNPTYTDDNNRIVVIDPGQEESQRSFTFITSIGLYDAYDNLLGVAKLSRPVLKNSQRAPGLKVRIDF